MVLLCTMFNLTKMWAFLFSSFTDDHGDDDDDDSDDDCDDAMERTSDLESDDEEEEVEVEEKKTKKKVSFNTTVEELKKKPLDPEQFKVMLLVSVLMCY